MNNKELISDASVKEYLLSAGLTDEDEMLVVLNDFMGVDASYTDVESGLTSIKKVIDTQVIK